MVGKTKHDRDRKLKQDQSAPYDNQIRAINIARGASGAVLRASPLFPVRVGLIFGSYNEHFSVSQRKSDRFTTSDKTSIELVSLARATIPKFLGVAFGPPRLGFSAAHSTWGGSGLAGNYEI